MSKNVSKFSEEAFGHELQAHIQDLKETFCPTFALVAHPNEVIIRKPDHMYTCMLSGHSTRGKVMPTINALNTEFPLPIAYCTTCSFPRQYDE